MDLQAIGIVLAAKGKSNMPGSANEDEFYQKFSKDQRARKVLELMSAGFTLMKGAWFRIDFKRHTNDGNRHSNDTA